MRDFWLQLGTYPWCFLSPLPHLGTQEQHLFVWQQNISPGDLYRQSFISSLYSNLIFIRPIATYDFIWHQCHLKLGQKMYMAICGNFMPIQVHDGFWLFLKVYYGQHVTIHVEKYNNRGRFFYRGHLNTRLLLFYCLEWGNLICWLEVEIAPPPKVHEGPVCWPILSLSVFSQSSLELEWTYALISRNNEIHNKVSSTNKCGLFFGF